MNKQSSNIIKSKILLVEDEPIVQTVHSAMLVKLGCQVDVAKNGKEVLEKHITDYSLILMDVGLPDISGIEVTEKIRSNEKSVRTPIVFITGYSESAIDEECLAAGGDAIYRKPLLLTSMQEIINKYATNV